MAFITRSLASLLLIGGLAACSPQDPQQATVANLAEHVLLPAYQRWDRANQDLRDSARAFCAGEQSLAEARQHFTTAQSAWAALQPLAVGPLSEGNRAWQVQFWPDKKNLVGRQIGQLIQRNPQVDEAALARASVVVQGLSAYEYLLYDESLDLDDAGQRQRYCPLLQAIGGHQAGLSGEVLGLWQAEQGMLAQLSHTPSERFADSGEALAEILRTQVSALDGLKKKLGTPMGRQTRGVPQPYQAEAWRSKASLASLAAALASAEQIWRGSDEKGVRQLVEDNALIEKLDAAYADVRGRLAALERPLGELLESAEGREALDGLYQSLDRLHRLHEGELARALQIPLGFNAHDGD